MAIYIPRSIFHLARLLYVRPKTFGPTLVLLHDNPFVQLRAFDAAKNSYKQKQTTYYRSTLYDVYGGIVLLTQLYCTGH